MGVDTFDLITFGIIAFGLITLRIAFGQPYIWSTHTFGLKTFRPSYNSSLNIFCQLLQILAIFDNQIKLQVSKNLITICG